MPSRAPFVSLFVLALASALFASTTPQLTIVSPVAVNSGGTAGTSYIGPNPVHFVGWAVSPDCPSGINAMRVYSSAGVLAYAAQSSFIDEQLNLPPGSYNSIVEVTDNCGGTSSVSLQEQAQASSGQVIITQPISNLPYQPGGLGLTVNATSTTTCAEGVNYMAMFIHGKQVAQRKGNVFEFGPKLAPGTYGAAISETDNCGGSTTAPLTIVVQRSGLPWNMGIFGFAYMPNASNGTIDQFYVPTTNCAMTPLFGNPAPAGSRPWAMARQYPFLFVLNQQSEDISVYYMDLNVSGELIQIPGSPFPVNEEPGYIPTGIAVPGLESIVGTFGVYVTNASSNGQPGTLSQLTIDVFKGEIEPMAPPYALRGNVQPTALYVGAEDGDGLSHYLLTSNGSSISVLDGLDYAPRYEDVGSPFPVPGLYGPSAGVQDMSVTTAGIPSYIYTANSEGSISAFSLDEAAQLTPLPGSPYSNPDNVAGTKGNPASVSGFVNFSTGSYIYLLNAGAEDVGIFSVDNLTGIPTYLTSRQKGLIHATSRDRIRVGGSQDQLCLVTSDGYSMFVNETSGLTFLEPGSPYLPLAEGIHPWSDIGMF